MPPRARSGSQASVAVSSICSIRGRRVVEDYHADNVPVKYQQYEMNQGRPLLREMLDTEFESEHHRKFRANRSLRDVEPEVDLYIREPTGRDVEP